MQNKIGLAIRVKNEIDLLDEFLTRNNVKETFAEVIFLDDMSTDGTYKKLKEYEAQGLLKVYRRDMNFDFASQRNYLDRLLDSEYILHIDIDQYITPELMEYITTFKGEKDIYIVNRQEIVNDELQDTTLVKVLYKNNKDFKWVNKIHSSLVGWSTSEKIPSKAILIHSKDSKRCEKQNQFYWDNFKKQRKIVRGLNKDKFKYKKFIAITASDNEKTLYLAKRLEQSFKYFHPDIPFIICTLEKELEVFGNNFIFPYGNKASNLRLRFLNHYLNKFDTVFWFDADTVVTGKLKEFLNVNYEIAGSLNVKKENNFLYMNTGVCSIAYKPFAEEWLRKCKDKEYIISHGFEQHEKQDIFNNIIKKNKYIFKCVDLENNYYNERSRPYWDKITIDSDKLTCNNRNLKVMHWAGGFDSHKISYFGFNKEVREFLNKITKTTNFTDNIGGKKWW